jgi:hypothetical protein
MPSSPASLGHLLGLDEDNYVKAVLATNPGIARVPLDFASLRTLDRFFVLDPAAHRVTVRYRANSDVAADIRTFGSADAAAFPELAGFFRLGTAAGILAANAAPIGSGHRVIGC